MNPTDPPAAASPAASPAPTADSPPATPAALWRRTHAEAIASSNAWVARHGLPLARRRLF